MRPQYPIHVAITAGGHKEYARVHSMNLETVYKRMVKKIDEIIDMQADLKIPIVTIFLITSKIRGHEQYNAIVDAMADFFKELKKSDVVHSNNIKISVLGKWYDLAGKAVEEIKETLEETMEYDKFFFNICVNYDGQEEIVDACRIIAKKIESGKLEADSITKEDIKENIYASAFVPPNLIVKTGKNRVLGGFLLWDSCESHIYFSGKLWLDFNKQDLMDAIRDYNKVK